MALGMVWGGEWREGKGRGGRKKGIELNQKTLREREGGREWGCRSNELRAIGTPGVSCRFADHYNCSPPEMA